MDENLILQYLFWKKEKILNVLKNKKSESYKVNEENLENFSHSIKKSISINEMKELEKIIEKQEKEMFLYDEKKETLYYFKDWIKEINENLENILNEIYAKQYEKTIEDIPEDILNKKIIKKIISEKEIRIDNLYHIPLDKIKNLEFDTNEKRIIFKEGE
ncbi:MAG: hypothetical protein E6Y25_01925 [Sneathia sanguinegens]|uniref:hypothetical protein n=1 Tax=Sneathia sanguinegens TaxID=40543 RepID=UPI002590734A|nr:hypothetical protein [Sneathia sanguinegens]MDU4652169.1 hypothetical protein [Sneathia sanguinegens]